MKKFMKLTVSLVLIISILAGCAKASEADNASADDNTTQAAKTKVTAHLV